MTFDAPSAQVPPRRTADPQVSPRRIADPQASPRRIADSHRAGGPAAAGADAILANARIVLEHEVIEGAVRIENGLIVSIDPGPCTAAGAQDMDGDLLIPGLVELHTDNLERHTQPRPGVDWPREAAVIAHDAELASVGITTVFDALRVGSVTSFERANYGKYARGLADAIVALKGAGALRISHFLHLRAEICSETLLQEMDEFGPEDDVRIVSLMDHTPGQRQFRDIDKLRQYHEGKYGSAGFEFQGYIDFLTDLKTRVGAEHENGAVERARALGAALASHDDTEIGHVAISAAQGCGIAEFPTTLAAAQACRDAGIAVMMGGPNLLRGGSHSGNVAAHELLDAGLLDIFSSDYAPSSLLMAAIRMGREGGDMPAGIRTVTVAPARAAGLADRGVVAPGLRADLARVSTRYAAPAVRGLWVAGARVG